MVFDLFFIAWLIENDPFLQQWRLMSRLKTDDEFIEKLRDMGENLNTKKLKH